MKVIGAWLESHLKSIFAGLAVLILLAVIIGFDYTKLANYRPPVLLVAFVVFVHVIVAMCIFTGPATQAKTHWTFAFCYWVAACVMLSCLAFFFVPAGRTDAPSWPQFDGPVGMVLGCSDFPPPAIQNTEDARPTELDKQKWVPREIACGNNTSQWLFNVGGKVILCPSKKDDACGETRVTGGMVVPLYFLIVALMGALISLSRSIPEYQGRLSPNSVARITPDEAREYLIFQLMQLFSAPLLALSAYYLVDPGSRAGVIALAFTVGFSSGTILLLIRSLVTKLAPENPPKSAIIVTPDKLEFGDCAVGSRSEIRTATFTNRGDGPLKVNSVLQGIVDADFEVVNPAPQAVPFLVASGQSFSLTVVFKPTSVGERSGSVTVADDGFGSPRIVNLSGKGIKPPDKGPKVALADEAAPAPAPAEGSAAVAGSSEVSGVEPAAVPPATAATASDNPAKEPLVPAADIQAPPVLQTAGVAANNTLITSEHAAPVPVSPRVSLEPIPNPDSSAPQPTPNSDNPSTLSTSSTPAVKGDPG